MEKADISNNGYGLRVVMQENDLLCCNQLHEAAYYLSLSEKDEWYPCLEIVVTPPTTTTQLEIATGWLSFKYRYFTEGLFPVHKGSTYTTSCKDLCKQWNGTIFFSELVSDKVIDLAEKPKLIPACHFFSHKPFRTHSKDLNKNNTQEPKQSTALPII